MAGENGRREEELQYAIKKITESLKDLSFGEVRITMHDSRVVQIERTEKVRLKESIFERGGGI